MARRSNSYDKMIATKMLDPEFARGVILHSLEFDDSIEEALRLAITSMGIKEFAEKSSIPVQNVSGFVRGKRNFGYRTLNRCLAVFDLKFTVTKNEVA
ncbi:MAG: helix-turn-helix transcriptional regulator [Pseudomonadota bacterium]|nr:helix-turn-helix transcriptional regulator [Pseudomonadota bacterium]